MSVSDTIIAAVISAIIAGIFVLLAIRLTHKSELKKLNHERYTIALNAIYEKLAIYVMKIDTRSTIDEIQLAYNDFYSTYTKNSTNVPIELEGIFQRYLEINTTRKVTMSFEQMINDPPVSRVEVTPANQPGYSKMLLREVKKYLEQ